MSKGIEKKRDHIKILFIQYRLKMSLKAYIFIINNNYNSCKTYEIRKQRNTKEQTKTKTKKDVTQNERKFLEQ